MDIKSNNGVYEIKSKTDFDGIISNRFNEFEAAKLKEERDANNDQLSSLAAAVQIGGTGVQIGLTGLKPNNELTRFSIPFSKSENLTEAAKENTKVINTAFEIVNFVSRTAEKLCQSVCNTIFGAAGFATNNPPEVKKAPGLNPKDHVYHFENIPLLDSKGSIMNEVDFNNLVDGYINKDRGSFRKYISSTKPGGNGHLFDATTSFTISSESLNSRASENFEVPFLNDIQIMNDTIAVAAARLEGLSEGENVLGLVDGSGFNIGAAKSYNIKAGKFRELKNPEAGHMRFKSVDDNFNLISPLDVPFTDATGKFLSDDERVKYAEGNLSPEKIFAGSSLEKNKIFSLVGQIRNLKSFLDLCNKDGNYRNAHLVHFNQYKNFSEDLNALGNIHEIDDQKIETAAINGNKLCKALATDLVQRLGLFIKGNFADLVSDLKRMNISGSFIQGLLSKLDLTATFKNALGKPELEINLIGRDEMDGMTTVIKTKANEESKRRIDALAAKHRMLATASA